MTDALNLILCILVVYRISRMIVGEMGPFNLFDKLRSAIMKRYDPNHWLYNGIGCPLCVSFWISAPVAIYAATDLLSWFMYWLAIAGAVTIIYRGIE